VRATILFAAVLGACGGAPPPQAEAPPGPEVPASGVSAAPAKEEPRTPLAREDWVMWWSAPKGTPGARMVVKKREEFADLPAAVLSKGEPPDLLALAVPVMVDAGKIIELRIPRDAVLAASVSGRAVKAYWTTRHEAMRVSNGAETREPFATMFVEGVQTGRGTIHLELVGDKTKSIAVEVR
jgi:hypothetical protein